MRQTAATLALEHASTTCATRLERLQRAMAVLEKRLAAAGPDRLREEDRYLIEQVVYRHNRLLEDMDTRLLPAILRALGEDTFEMADIARIEMLEQLGWLPAAQEWLELRRRCGEIVFRNFRPGPEHSACLQFALASSRRLTEILVMLGEKMRNRFPSVRVFKYQPGADAPGSEYPSLPAQAA